MPRFYSPYALPDWPPTPPGASLPDAPVVHLDDAEIRHARKVLRLAVGDAVEVGDGQGRLAQAVIIGGDHGMTLRLTSCRHLPEPRPAITIAAAAPKGARADDMVNQLSQLGATRFIPLHTVRSVVEPGAGKIDRYIRIAVESAKQCGRAYLLRVTPVMPFSQVLRLPADLRLLASPAAAASSDFVARLRHATEVLILIGPEGGWTEDELQQAQAAGFLGWSLSPNILRIETAAAAAAGIARYLAAYHDPVALPASPANLP